MKHDPDDPEGQYQRESYRLNEFCASEGYVPIQRESTITDLVHEVINQRERIGMATYHRPLLAGDGRDTLQDAIEEAADLLQYLVKLKTERDGVK